VGPVFLTSYVLLWLLVAVLTIGLLAIYRHFGEIYQTSREARDAQGPREGQLLGAAELTTVDGTAVLLPPAMRDTLVLFVSVRCNVCATVRSAIPRLLGEYPTLDVVVLCEGRPGSVRMWAESLAGTVPVVADPRGRHTLFYEVALIPFGVLVGPDGVVRRRTLVNSYDGLKELVDGPREPAHGDDSAAGANLMIEHQH
jgi:hypothetical protein